MAEIVNLYLKIGTDQRFDCTVLNKSKTAAVDINGWGLSWMVKRHASDVDASAVIAKTTASGITITGLFNETPSLNAQLARVTVADDDTNALKPAMYVYELKRTDPGFETILLGGSLTLSYAVHRA